MFVQCLVNICFIRLRAQSGHSYRLLVVVAGERRYMFVGGVAARFPSCCDLAAGKARGERISLFVRSSFPPPRAMCVFGLQRDIECVIHLLWIRMKGCENGFLHWVPKDWCSTILRRRRLAFDISAVCTRVISFYYISSTMILVRNVCVTFILPRNSRDTSFRVLMLSNDVPWRPLHGWPAFTCGHLAWHVRISGIGLCTSL